MGYGTYVFAFILGMIVCFSIHSWIIRRTLRYAGTLKVTRDGEARSFLLDLEMGPEEFEAKKAVLFKVDVSDRE